MDLNALYELSYGLYVISANANTKVSACVANTVIQITSTPLKCCVVIAKANFTHELMMECKSFGVSVLSQSCSMDTIANFGFISGRDNDKFLNIPHTIDIYGNPLLVNEVTAVMSCKITDTIDVGTHTIFVATIDDAKKIGDGVAMTYSYYHDVKNGTSPKNAPTFQKKREEKSKGTHRCTVCNYIYNPELGDAKGGIAPGVDFSNLPEDWVCPICKHGKEVFVEI